ncbi:MAG: ABC transporter permease, partial [Lutibacter sp.]
MLKNYFKILIRGLFKNKGYSVLNIFGLAIGITCASLIFLWVENELDYNKSFPNKDYIHKILTSQEYNGEIYTFDATPGILAPTLKGEEPGIKYITRFNEDVRLVTLDEKTFYKNGAYVDDDFYNIFSIKFIEGSISNVKSDINGIVITQKTAKQYFGTDNNIVGKTLKLDNTKDSKITGVIADLPENVSLQFDWLISFKAYEIGKDFLNYWGNNATSTIVQLTKEADFNAVNSAVKKIIPKNSDNEGRIYGFLHSINDWYLRGSFKNGIQNDGRIIYVHLFSFIAIIILIIACINFMNLATARSIKRANEVGIRKVLGSKRIHLISQFFLESFILTTIATIISVFLILLLLPQFNQIIGENLQIGLTNPMHITVLVGIIIFCSVLSGCYPALYLSSFKPVVVLNGLKGKQGGATFIRNGLVVVQFAASIIFIISTIVIYTQIKHVKNRDIGYDKSNLVSINIQGDLLKNY